MGAACSNSAEEKRDCIYALSVGGLTNGSGLLQFSRGKKGLFFMLFL